MGFKTFGFGGGRADMWEPEQHVNWGAEDTWLGDERYSGDRELARPPRRRADGPHLRQSARPERQSRSAASARDIRETFARMAMNDEETVALIAGGHTFGKAHGAGPESHVGKEPEGADIEHQGLGWASTFESGMAGHTITSGLEGAWTPTPTKWDNGYLRHAVRLRVGADEEPGRREPVEAEGRRGAGTVPDAHDKKKKHRADDDDDRPLAAHGSGLREDLAPLSQNPQEFADAFAKAWFKLTHRDMGPKSLYRGKLVPKETLIWQDPIPAWTTS